MRTEALREEVLGANKKKDIIKSFKKLKRKSLGGEDVSAEVLQLKKNIVTLGGFSGLSFTENELSKLITS